MYVSPVHLWDKSINKLIDKLNSSKLGSYYVMLQNWSVIRSEYFKFDEKKYFNFEFAMKAILTLFL